MSRFGGGAFFVSWSGRSAIGNTTTGNTVNVRANAAAVTDGIAHDCLFAIVPDKAHTERLFEASARAGRAKSDYSLHGENAGYDGSNAY